MKFLITLLLLAVLIGAASSAPTKFGDISTGNITVREGKYVFGGNVQNQTLQFDYTLSLENGKSILYNDTGHIVSITNDLYNSTAQFAYFRNQIDKDVFSSLLLKGDRFWCDQLIWPATSAGYLIQGEEISTNSPTPGTSIWPINTSKTGSLWKVENASQHSVNIQLKYLTLVSGGNLSGLDMSQLTTQCSRFQIINCVFYQIPGATAGTFCLNVDNAEETYIDRCYISSSDNTTGLISHTPGGVQYITDTTIGNARISGLLVSMINCEMTDIIYVDTATSASMFVMTNSWTESAEFDGDQIQNNCGYPVYMLVNGGRWNSANSHDYLGGSSPFYARFDGTVFGMNDASVCKIADDTADHRIWLSPTVALSGTATTGKHIMRSMPQNRFIFVADDGNAYAVDSSGIVIDSVDSTSASGVTAFINTQFATAGKIVFYPNTFLHGYYFNVSNNVWIEGQNTTLETAITADTDGLNINNGANISIDNLNVDAAGYGFSNRQALRIAGASKSNVKINGGRYSSLFGTAGCSGIKISGTSSPILNSVSFSSTGDNDAINVTDTSAPSLLNCHGIGSGNSGYSAINISTTGAAYIFGGKYYGGDIGVKVPAGSSYSWIMQGPTITGSTNCVSAPAPASNVPVYFAVLSGVLNNVAFDAGTVSGNNVII